MVAVSSVLAGVGMVAGLAMSAASMAQQDKAQRRSLEQQEQAQQQAASQARRQEQLAEENINAANRKTPDISSILARAAQSGSGGSTLLTGSTGIDNRDLTLGRSGLLGR